MLFAQLTGKTQYLTHGNTTSSIPKTYQRAAILERWI